jgi:hypothetical protein
MSTSPAIVTLLPVILGPLFALGCLIGSFFFLRRKRLIDDLPTSKTQGVFIGLTELKGTAESDTPLESYLGRARCVQFKWQVQEHWSRMVTETYTDAKGNMHTRTRVESGWTTVADGEQSIPFYLKDDAGIIRVVPERADIHGNEVFDQTCGRDDDLYFSKGPVHEIANATHRRRFRETAISLHTMLYVVGQARERKDVVAAEIAYSSSAPVFIISTKTEKQVTRGFSIGFWSLLLLSLVLVMAGIGISAALAQAGIYWQPFAIGVAAFLLAAATGWLWTVYNSIVGLRQRVRQAWSQVDIQLKRRNDLIPNLVQVIEGYKKHEREVQQDVTEMRGQLSATPPGMPGDDFNGIASKLRVVVERYPELKASDMFLKLQQELTGTEERIAMARDYYNDIATFYNMRLGIIPERFVAALAGCRPRQLMSAGDFERAPVKVTLAE